MRKRSKKEQGKKKNSGLYAGLIAVVALALIVQKDMSLPSWVLIGGTMIAFMLLFIKSLKSPVPAFLAIVCYVPFSKVLVGDFGGLIKAFNFTNVLMVLVVFGMFAQAGRTGRKLFEKNLLNIPCLLFCLIICFSFVRGSFYFGHYGDFMELLSQAKRWITPILLFFLAFNAVRDRDTAKNVIRIVMLVTLLVGLMAVWDYMNVGAATSFENSRIGGIAEQPNQLAGFFVYYMFLYAGFILIYAPSFTSLVLIVPFLIIFRGIMVTFSRGGYLSFVAGGLGLTFFRNKILFIFVCLCMMFLVLNPAFLPAGIRYRMGMTFEESEVYDENELDSIDASAGRRIEIWKTAVYMIKDQPLVGYGYATFPNVLASYAPQLGAWDAHNSYLIMAAEMGIPAVFVFLWIVVIFFKEARWVYRRSKDKFFKASALGMLGGISGLLLVNVFGSRLNSLEISGYFWILAGVILRMKAIEKEDMLLTRQTSKAPRQKAARQHRRP